MILCLLFLASVAHAAPAGNASVRAGNETTARPSEDYEAFIASEAERLRSAGSGPDDLARSLGIVDLLGARAGAVLHFTVSTQAARGGLVRTRLFFRGPTGAFNALQLAPDASASPRPAALVVHGLGADAPAAAERLGEKLAAGGFVVLIPEPINGVEKGRAFNDAFNLLLAGRTLTGLRVYEQVLLLDYLQSLPSVDSGRVAVAGQGSAGLTARWVARVDPRPRAVVVDSRQRAEPYFEAASELLVPGLMRFTDDPPAGSSAAPVLTVDAGFPDVALVASWLGRAFKGRAASETRGDGSRRIARFFAAYKGAAPSDPDALVHYGLAAGWRARGRFAEALTELEKALKAAPDRLAVRAMLARTYEDLGDLKRAREQYSEIFRLDPDRLESHLQLASAYERQGEPGRALERYESAAALAPESEEARLRLAGFYESLGRWPDARREYERASDLAPDPIPARLGLSYALLKEGDQARADQELRAASAADPGLAANLRRAAARARTLEERVEALSAPERKR